ncbi:MAG TPA: serine hydrolase domain-containing protein, partial [Kofleriaceae bacterium]
MLRASVFSVLLALCACSDSGDKAMDAGPSDDGSMPDSGSATGMTCAQLEQKISDELDVASMDTSIVGSPDYTLLLQTADGRTYTHSHGSAGPTVVYESASTSKLVTAVVIMDLVEQGYMTLETKAHDLIPFWTENTVTLRELLDFTSGYFRDP